MDLIDRHDVTDSIVELWANKPFGNPALSEICECIKRVPSAEPEVKCVANVSFDEDDLKRIVHDIVDNLELDVIRCKDCKHFELNKKYVIQGIPILGHEVCDAWGDGCKTSPDGFCFMAERRQDE